MSKSAKFAIWMLVLYILAIFGIVIALPTLSIAQTLNATIKLGDQVADARIKSRNLSAQLANDSTDFSVKAWGDECSFKVMGLTPKQTKFYKKPNGNLEWEINLNNKPDTRILTYPIETKGLRFLRQDSAIITNDPRISAPDSVLNSYWAMHPTGYNNVTKIDGTREEYKAGIAFAIYRIRAWDSNGDTVWGDMDIDTIAGTFSIIIPEQFREYAVYPVVIDPDVGYTTLGGVDLNPDEFDHYFNYEDSTLVTTGGDMDYAFVGSRSVGGTNDGKANSWLTAGGTCADMDLHFSSDVITLANNATLHWDSVTAGGSFTSSTWYTISYAAEINATVRLAVVSDPGATSQVVADTDFTAPADLTGCSAGSDIHYSTYISYTEAGAPAVLQGRRRRLIQESSFNYPDTVDSALLVEFGFEFRDGFAIGAYDVYDPHDNPQDVALICLEMPTRPFDINRNGLTNILDLTYWIQSVYYGGF